MIRGIILAAGRGNRMGPSTKTHPKGLITLGGQPLIEWQCAALRTAGVKKIAVVTGYKASVLEGLGLPTFHNSNWANTNMISSLARARSWLTRFPCVVSYADIFYAPSDLLKLVSTADDISIAYDPNWLTLWSLRFDNPLDDAETFRLRGGRITDIGQKPTAISDIEGQYMGLMKFTPVGWGAVAQLLTKYSELEQDQLDATTLLNSLVKSGTSVCGVPIENQWGEVDHPSDLTLYEQKLAAGAYPWAKGLDFRK